MNNNPATYPLVSIVIPMLNEIDAIERCIRSIWEQDYPQDRLEIVVVDGLSTDGSREKVQALMQIRDNVRLLDNPTARTPASLNIGARGSRGDVVIILGAHTRLKSDFIRQNIKHMQIMDVACTGGTQINTGVTFLQQAIGYAMGSQFGMPSAPYRFFRKPRFVDTVVYAAYKRGLFDKVGYFDEELHISEDAEFNWRIRQAGHRIYFSPEIVSYYYPRKNLRLLAKQFLNYGILRVNVMKKHRDAVKLLHLLPPLFLTISLVSAALAFVRPFSLNMLAAIWALYLVYVLLASVITAQQQRCYRHMILLPAVFMVMQLCWATGFLIGIFKTYK
jgi:cellulose synthase/poly-beta-1,6-N-acetylglucosamine synthase-like glycosyltransferase